jgi:hypothetical protein
MTKKDKDKEKEKERKLKEKERKLNQSSTLDDEPMHMGLRTTLASSMTATASFRDNHNGDVATVAHLNRRVSDKPQLGTRSQVTALYN